MIGLKNVLKFRRLPVGERSALEERTCASSGGQSESKNVGLSNANVGENPMPRKS
ncbi:hypothetical protein AHAS_Ahas12G0036500 [Arachis hypogaea]